MYSRARMRLMLRMRLRLILRLRLRLMLMVRMIAGGLYLKKTLMSVRAGVVPSRSGSGHSAHAPVPLGCRGSVAHRVRVKVA